MECATRSFPSTATLLYSKTQTVLVPAHNAHHRLVSQAVLPSTDIRIHPRLWYPITLYSLTGGSLMLGKLSNRYFLQWDSVLYVGTITFYVVGTSISSTQSNYVDTIITKFNLYYKAKLVIDTILVLCYTISTHKYGVNI